MVSEEDRPLFREEARESAEQVTLPKSGLAGEMLLGNINRIAAFGFHYEALKIVRAIENSFERACMLLVIYRYFPDPERQKVEAETRAAVRAIEDESTRMWLLTWMLRDAKQPLRAEVVAEIEGYALSIDLPILRAAIFTNMAFEIEEERERLLASANELVLNNFEETEYETMVMSPFTYTFPVHFRRTKESGKANHAALFACMV